MPEDAKLYVLNPSERKNDSLRVVNGYSLTEEIGRGGTAIAYRAEKEGLEFCVREHRFGRMPNDDALKAHELFEREAEVLQKLEHPLIPQVYDLFDFGDGSNFSIYMVQQLMPGKCLQSQVENDGIFSEEQTVDFMLSVTDVLKYLHNQTPAVVHKDIKPSNIMYDKETGTISLIDFGILQQAFVNTIGGSTTFGTVGYSAPEVFFGQANPRSDLYSLAPTMINLASGLEPHNLLEGIQIEYKDKFRFKNPSLEVLLDQLLQFNPENRPKNAEEIANYLEQIKAGKQLTKPKENAGRVKRFFASLIPDSLVRFLVGDRASVVEEEQRNKGLLVSSNTLTSYPRIEVLNGEARVEHMDEYRIYHGIPMVHKANQEQTLVITKDLLFGGKALRQEEYVQSLEGSELSLLTAPEYLSWVAYLDNNQNHPDKKQKGLFKEDRKWLKDLFRRYWLMTGTQAIYQPDGSGGIIQGLGRDDMSLVEIPQLVGPDGWLKDMNSNPAIENILGTDDLNYVNSNFKKISGKNSYFWRINQKPSKVHERPVVLGLDGFYRFVIFADYDFSNDWRALGVVNNSCAKKSP
jgi:serine/threonine protein kinase